ncbi:hypothetical protein [Treponema phagedenis]|uniref:LPD3 domain-containing protein n=1 Tax=Treponema phagedenis TaxID=162 RepID=UPI0011E7798C|nr:hypothetical protein [Treponema phagedenis]QEK05298.1 hypothetical protein FUT80_00175 [Treponema phagedenis]
MRIVTGADVSKQIIHTLKSLSERQHFTEILERMQKTFVESKHPRDEEGRFTDKREEKTCLKENISSASDVKQALEAIKNTDIVNKKTGIIARISSTGINKMISNKAVEKSEANGFTRQEHYRAAAQIKDLFEKAHLIEARADKNNDPNIQSIKRFYSSVVLEDGREGKALITLKETYQSGHRIYTVELNRIIKPIDMRKAVAQYAQSAYSPSTSKGWETTDTHARTRTEQKAPTDFSIPHSQKKARAQNAALPKDFVSRCNMVSIQLMLLKWDIAAIQEEIDRRNNMYDLVLKSFNKIVQELKKTQGSKQRRL